MKRGRPKIGELDYIDQKVAIQLYLEKMWSMAHIARALGVSYWEVREVFKRIGVPFRHRGKFKRAKEIN